MKDQKLRAKEYLQDKYPSMRGERWNSTNINDEWIAQMMEEYAAYISFQIIQGTDDPS